MKKEKVVDYFQAMRDFDHSLGKKLDDFDIPLKDSVVADGRVDYLKVSREYEKYQEQDHSEMIHIRK